MSCFRGARLSVSAAALAFSCLAAGFSTSANATVVSGSSEGYGVKASASVVGSLITLDVVKTPDSAGTAPIPYNIAQVDVNLDVAAEINLLGLTTVTTGAVDGLLSSTASSNVNGTPGAKITQASAEVDNLGVQLGAISVLAIPLSTLLNLSASVITSSAQVSGDFPLLTVAGNSVLTNLTLAINGAPINLSAFVDVNGMAAPNTTLGLSALGIAGLTIVLNEQVVTGNSISVNAIHITATALDLNTDGLGLLSADIVIAHSEAQMTAVPEPTSLSVLGVSACALLLRRRKTV